MKGCKCRRLAGEAPESKATVVNLPVVMDPVATIQVVLPDGSGGTGKPRCRRVTSAQSSTPGVQKPPHSRVVASRRRTRRAEPGGCIGCSDASRVSLHRAVSGEAMVRWRHGKRLRRADCQGGAHGAAKGSRRTCCWPIGPGGMQRLVLDPPIIGIGLAGDRRRVGAVLAHSWMPFGSASSAPGCG